MKVAKILMAFLLIGLFSIFSISAYAETDVTTGLAPSETAQEPLEPIKVQAPGGNILWDTYHGIYFEYSPSNRYSTLTSILTSSGYTMDENASGILNLNLNNYDIIVICLGSAWNSAYSSAEVAAIQNFVSGGGGLVILGDNALVANSNINPVSQAFGTTCGVSDIANSTITNTSSHTIFQSVSSIVFTAGGELSAVSPSSVEAWSDANKPVVTVAMSGLGRVVTVGDVNFCDNTYISLGSNQQFAENIFAWVSTPAVAWDICVQDVQYATEYQFNVESGIVIRGMAYGSSSSFPAPITGTYNSSNNYYSFTIGYLNDNSRHYWVSGYTGAGYTWGILGSDSSFFQTPRDAQLGFCPAQTTESAEGETGDSK